MRDDPDEQRRHPPRSRPRFRVGPTPAVKPTAPGLEVWLGERLAAPPGRMEYLGPYSWAHVVRYGDTLAVAAELPGTCRVIRVVVLDADTATWIVHEDAERPDLAGVRFEVLAFRPAPAQTQSR